MKKLNNISIVIIASCIILNFCLSEYCEILSKAVFLFIGVWIGILYPLIILLFFKKIPRVNGTVTDLSEGRIWGRTIVTIEFEYEDVIHIIYKTHNSDEAPAVGTVVTVMVDRKEIQDSTFEEKDSFYSSQN